MLGSPTAHTGWLKQALPFRVTYVRAAGLCDKNKNAHSPTRVSHVRTLPYSPKLGFDTSKWTFPNRTKVLLSFLKKTQAKMNRFELEFTNAYNTLSGAIID